MPGTPEETSTPPQSSTFTTSLSLVTEITISGDDSHRWRIRSLLSLRLGWSDKTPVQAREAIAYGFIKRQRAAFKSSTTQKQSHD